MQSVYDFVSSNPQLITWGIVIVNALWILFAHFDKQRHERKLIELRQELEIDADRRIKILERRNLKYEAYVETLDALTKQNSHEVMSHLLKVFSDLFVTLGDLFQAEPEERQRILDQWIKQSASTLNNDSDAKLTVLASSNHLKLVASDQVLASISKLEEHQLEWQSITKEFFSFYRELAKPGSEEKLKWYQESYKKLDELVKTEAQAMMDQMRRELRN